MLNRFRPAGSSLVGMPVTSRNTLNTNNHPSIVLGGCTPSQLLHRLCLNRSGMIGVIGNPSRGIALAETMIRQSDKPFLFVGPAADSDSVFSALNPTWILDTAVQRPPDGNGAILLSKPHASYLEMCEYVEGWSADRFLILHLSDGVKVGPELLNALSGNRQCLIFCDCVPQGLRHTEARTITPKEFFSQMTHLMVFSSGAATNDLIELLPTYHYEEVANTTSLNSFHNRSVFHPFRSHKGHGMSVGQSRTVNHHKHLFEADELQQIYDRGQFLWYDTRNNAVYLGRLV